jgi:2-polyprenyl-3-methyl-5-hydroxy-6-metoxy-1,4-benzoquinol methylase
MAFAELKRKQAARAGAEVTGIDLAREYLLVLGTRR